MRPPHRRTLPLPGLEQQPRTAPLSPSLCQGSRHQLLQTTALLGQARCAACTQTPPPVAHPRPARRTTPSAKLRTAPSCPRSSRSSMNAASALCSAGSPMKAAPKLPTSCGLSPAASASGVPQHWASRESRAGGSAGRGRGAAGPRPGAAPPLGLGEGAGAATGTGAPTGWWWCCCCCCWLAPAAARVVLLGAKASALAARRAEPPPLPEPPGAALAGTAASGWRGGSGRACGLMRWPPESSWGCCSDLPALSACCCRGGGGNWAGGSASPPFLLRLAAGGAGLSLAPSAQQDALPAAARWMEPVLLGCQQLLAAAWG